MRDLTSISRSTTAFASNSAQTSETPLPYSDRLFEAGSYISVGALVGKDFKVKNIIPEHLESLFSKLEEIGVDFTIDDDEVVINSGTDYNPVEIKTQVYPGFPTDLQQPITPLLMQANGTSKVSETVYPARFRHIDELSRMNARLEQRSGAVFIEQSKLTGAEVYASDLRAGFCLVAAGLNAEGTTTIHNIHHVMRGYSGIIDKLISLGADIELVTK